MSRIVKKIIAIALLAASFVAFSCSFESSMRGDEDENGYIEDSEIVEVR